MRKYIISISLFISFCLVMNAQTDNPNIWKKVDSLKKELRTAKGETKINCLNRLAGHYFGIWDVDDKFRDTACIFSNRAYEEATKLKYKQGIAFALAGRALCAMSLTDNDRNNNDKEAAYANAYKEAGIAIKYAEELNNNYIIGNVYDNLRWMEKWRGTPDKLKTNTENAILHFEKVNSNDFKTGYNPLTLVNCSGCKGTENLLGWLYLELSRTQSQFNITMKEQIEKAIYYYQRSGSRSGLAGAYMSYGMLLAITKDLEAGIEYLKKAVVGFHEDNSNRSELQALTELCNSYWALGDFENGLEYGKRSVQIAEALLKLKDAGDADTLRLGQSYFRMGRFYTIAGDYETAFTVLKKARIYYPGDPRWLDQWTIAMGELYRLTGNYDSASYYLEPFAHKPGGNQMLSNLYISMNQYDKALQLLNEASKVAENRNDLPQQGVIYINKAKAYFGKNDYASALKSAREGVSILLKVKRKITLMDGYQVLSDIYNKLGKNDSAYYYLKQHTTLKDSVLNRQFFIRLNDYKKEAEELRKTSQLNLMNKDNQLKEQKFKQDAQFKNALLLGLLALLLIGIFVFRTLSLKRKNEKLANEKTKAELQQKISDLEMQALRAQMNPHFIFNCLSSINKFILKNDTDAASDYLTRFSRLIRQVLTNSQLSLIPLSDEIEMLRLYLDMERLRFSETFSYNIVYENTIEPETIYIPPMLLQPFCENAIWHGLMHKEGQGKLEVIMSLQNGELQCIIADNGIGREKAADLKSRSNGKQKSFGLKITTERLALFNDEKAVHSFYRTEDVLDSNGNIAGTMVILNIKFKNSVQQPVKETV